MINNNETKEYYKTHTLNELPLVSVIIPVYNAEKYLKRAILSVLNQTYKKIEILCIDDGSIDNSESILRALQIQDNRIKIISKPNGGPASARNAGLDHAQGKYISFVDSDDEIEQTAYEFLVWKAETTNADIVIFGGTCIPQNDVPNWISQPMTSLDHVYDEPSTIKYALFHEPASRPFLWLHFIKRSLFESAPQLRMDESMDLGEDQYFQYCYFPRASKVIFSSEHFYKYYWNNEGSTMWKNNQLRITKFKKHIALTEATLQYWTENNISDPLNELVSWMVDLLYWDFIRFPKYLQVYFAKTIVNIILKYRSEESIRICGDINKQAEEIFKLASLNIDPDNIIEEDINTLKTKINNVEAEIIDTMKSKTYKIGRLLTPKFKRLDETSILPKERKKN